jgi:hypothetical protein
LQRSSMVPKRLVSLRVVFSSIFPRIFSFFSLLF